MAYQNLEQRLAHTYLDTFPEFIPSDDGPGTSEQNDFYLLLKSVYQLAFDEPLLFVSSLHEDDAYPWRFNKSSYAKPDLRKNMQTFIKAVDDLLAAMYQMGINENSLKLSKRQRIILDRLGIGETVALPAAWTWMSRREGGNQLSFSKCLFRKDYPYPSDVFARLFGDQEAFHRLEKWMTERGYARYCCLDGRMSMDYANLSWDKDLPLGGSLYKVRHTGISVSYDEMAREPQLLGLRIPNGLKRYLEVFDRMDTRVKDFVVAQTKKCDACGYCTQTDKTGKRPKACIPVTYQAEIYLLCPLFPGCSFCWSSVSEALAENLIAMLTYMDSLLLEKR